MEITDVLLIGLIIGVVQVFKMAGMGEKLAPAISVVLGVASGVFIAYPADVKSGIIFGLMIGLSACGLYSGTKNTISKPPDSK